MPPLIGRRRVEEFRRAFESEIDSLAALYRNASADMLDILADAGVLAGQRTRAAALLRQYQVVLAKLGDEAAAWIELNIPRAYGLGLEFADTGIRNIRRAGINVRRAGTGRGLVARRERDVFSQVHREAVAAITEEMLHTTGSALAQIGRRVDDAFRRVGVEEVAKGIVQGRTRRDVSRQIRERLVSEAGPAFFDRRGRRWDLEDYAEMVARTTTREAMTEGTINRLREHGITLAQVSRHVCDDFCVYYEDVVVNIGDEPHPVYPPISAINGGPPFHPRCLPSGQRVVTRRGPVPIERVRIGDEVLTHRGRFRPVTAVFSRHYEGTMVTLAAGRAKVSATPEHPVLTPGGWVAAGHVVSQHFLLAVGHHGQDFGEHLPWAAPKARVRHADDLPSLARQKLVAHAIALLSARVPVALPVQLHVQKNGGEGEVEDVSSPRHLEAPSLSQAASAEQGHERALALRRAASAAECLPTGAGDASVVEPRRVVQPHPERVAGIQVGGLLSEPLALVSLGTSRDSEPIHGFENSTDVSVGEFPPEVRQRTALQFIPALQVPLQRLSDAPFHAGEGPPELQLAATDVAAGASWSLRRGPAADGPAADLALESHRSPPMGMRDPRWVPITSIREQRRVCRVFNLEVHEDQSYVVEGFVVHNCAHALTPFVEALATKAELKAGILDPKVLNRTPAELQGRYRKS